MKKFFFLPTVSFTYVDMTKMCLPCIDMCLYMEELVKLTNRTWKMQLNCIRKAYNIFIITCINILINCCRWGQNVSVYNSVYRLLMPIDIRVLDHFI